MTVNEEGSSRRRRAKHRSRGREPNQIIARNGVQFGFGSTGTVAQNDISDNVYTGVEDASSTASC